MTPENSLVLAASAIGSVFLCGISLQQINNYNISYSKPIPLSFYCNYFVLGMSSGIFLCISKIVIKNNN